MDCPNVYTDVLIVGAGVSGYTAAATLSHYNVNFRMIEKRSMFSCIKRANCFQPRTQEVLQTLNLRHALDTRGSRIPESAFWRRDATGELARKRIVSERDNLTPYPYLLIADQGSVDATFEEHLMLRGHTVERSMELSAFAHNTSQPTIWPLIAYVKNHATGLVEMWYTKYILGCDGTHSRVRHLTDIQLENFGEEDSWITADMIADTDFPDRRRRTLIQSSHGACMLMPGLYQSFQIHTLLSPDIDLANSTDLLFMLQARISEILLPYRFIIQEITSIKKYTNLRRLVNSFSDPTRHIFLLGSACYTHSPTTDQTLNSSIMDAYNLTCKLAFVIHQGLADPASIFSTYESERRLTALQLFDSDIQIDRTFRGPSHLLPTTSDVNSLKDAELPDYTNGYNICYAENLLINPEVRTNVHSTAPRPLAPGQRLLPLTLTRHMDGNIISLIDEMLSVLQFHLLVFAGDLLASPIFAGLCALLTSLLPTLNSPPPPPPQHATITSCHPAPLLSLFLIHTSPHLSLPLSDLLPPWSQHEDRVYEDVDGKAHSDIGVPRRQGALVLLRPDGVVAMVTNLDDGKAIGSFLGEILDRAGRGSRE